MTFTINRLVGHRAVVRGTDNFDVAGEEVLDTSQWDELNSRTDTDRAEEAFTAAVEEFFAPLTEAAEALSKGVERPTDSVSYVVLSEAVEGVPSQPAQVVHLDRSSIILRLIEQGDTDRLVWVDGSLEVLEATETVPVNGAGVPDDVPASADYVSGDEPTDVTGDRG